MSELFKWYDYDIVWNDESVCDNVWSKDNHDDTGSQDHLTGSRFISPI